MHDFSAEFAAHISREVTQLCWCWQVIRADGLRLGFTDHDQDIDIDGLSYKGRSGFSGTDIDAKLGFSIDNNAVQGAFKTDDISAADLEAGLYEHATLIVMRVVWSAPDIHAQIWRGSFGAISRSDTQFNIELIGQSAILARSTGRVFSKMCDAQFGDERCGLNAQNFPEGTVCPRSFEACRDLFSNAENYRGFPYLIGDDALQSSSVGSAVLDGGSRYS